MAGRSSPPQSLWSGQLTEAHQNNAKIAVLKVSYLLAVTVVVFAMPALSLTRPVRWFVIPTLLGIQVITLLVCRVGLRDTLWSASRLKWLFVFLLGMYALLPSGSPSENDVLLDWHVPGLGWSVPIDLSGLEQAGLMCLQILTVLLASAVVRLASSRWGGTAAGSIMGVISCLQGDGRFGALGILKHIAPGLVIDLGEPLVRRLPRWALGYCALGFFAAIARTATEFVVVLLLGARAEIYLFPAVKLVPNLIAGMLSGFVTMFVLRVLAEPAQPGVTPATESARSP